MCTIHVYPKSHSYRTSLKKHKKHSSSIMIAPTPALDEFHTTIRSPFNLLSIFSKSEHVTKDIPLSFGRPLDIQELIRGTFLIDVSNDFIENEKISSTGAARESIELQGHISSVTDRNREEHFRKYCDWIRNILQDRTNRTGTELDALLVWVLQSSSRTSNGEASISALMQLFEPLCSPHYFDFKSPPFLLLNAKSLSGRTFVVRLQ